MHLYNSLTRSKSELGPEIKELNLFVCGPTVYDNPHIGNARTYLVFDAFVRYLRHKNKKVFYLQNITDIDDKIITRANKEARSWRDIARKYEEIYHSNEKTLGITSVTRYARATDYINDITDQVQRLIKKGCAYKIEGDGYYFDISTFPSYGKLSGRTAQQAEDATSRIDDSVHKKNKGDFALWKFSKKGEPSWESPLGEGRPGWHIEDTAITEHFFGPQYDIHGGASDLKFPHHEAEIAQQESVSGKSPLARIWMHTGFLTMEGKKMSKSEGNFVTISDFLSSHDPRVLRYIALSHHYRSPVDFTHELVSATAHTLSSLQALLWKLSRAKGRGANISLPAPKEAQTRFFQALDDDFNTPQAFASVFEYIAQIEPIVWELARAQAIQAQHTIQELFSVVGIHLSLTPRVPFWVRILAWRRSRARKNQQFIQSDTLRDKISALGYTIEDTPQGAFVYPTKIIS